jgi:hypothetical protein
MNNNDGITAPLHSSALVMLAPIYILLSIAAILSRYNRLLKSLASHGKTRHSSSYRWLDFQLPKRYFAHFYVTGLLSATWIFYLMGEIQFLLSSQWLLFAHLCRRVYECWYIHQFRPQSKMHLAGYVLGIGHYGILPLVFVGRIRGSVPFAIEVVCCLGNLWMQYEQHMHHRILANLRPLSAHANDHVSYKLPPKQRWFRWSLSPHYLAEILLYFSWAVLLSFQAAQPVDMSQWSPIFPWIPATTLRALEFLGTQCHWFLFFWVLTNLSVSSLTNHDWYFQKCSALSQSALFPWWSLLSPLKI